jgi:hypothetical protein
MVEEVVLLRPQVQAEPEAHGAALQRVRGGVLEPGAVVRPVVHVADVAHLLDADPVAVDLAGEPPDAADDGVVQRRGARLGPAAPAAGVGWHRRHVAPDDLDQLEVEGADDGEKTLVDDVVGDVVVAVLALDEAVREAAGKLGQGGCGAG